MMLVYFFQALTGDRIVSRCHRVRTLLEHNLRKIKYMVSVALARKVSLSPFFSSFFLNIPYFDISVQECAR